MDAAPALVTAATERARSAGFPLSCVPAVGRLLAVLAVHLPPNDRVLELGTGAGVGTAWIASALLPRTDVTVTTVEFDPQTAAVAAQNDWPAYVDLRTGDALDLLNRLGSFDLIFADAPAGKWDGLDRTIAALNPHGLLVVDDMTPMADWTNEQRTRQDGVRRTLLTDPRLVSVEIDQGSGVILSTSRGK
ncbi:MAG: methyltransferase domain-containing protein [Streptosporangiales bacterium]|nr:methyltransferase domain-containing protein [Streptosporangiales bacterium]